MINVLDEILINRISAGEVVESPFSIVKELIDNSIDAGATRINIEIKNGGIDYIKVKDNGAGIEYNDIKKAFLPHATSKIKSVDDLNSILTLGFRGGALASISNVSQTKMITRQKQTDVAYTIDVDGGVFSNLEATSGEIGTTIEVKNLFFNTPARRKFLKKPKQEENQITNIISRYILANPSIDFKYVADDKTIYQTCGHTLLDAIYCVYGEEIKQNIMPVNKRIGNIELKGYVSKVGYSKPNTTYQTLMVNSRYVIDETVSKACYMANEEYLMHRQFPVYIFNLNLPADQVDVNVHPSKINIKFANPSQIYSLVYSAVREAIYNFINPQVEENKENIEQNPTKTTQQNLVNMDLNSMREIEIEPLILPNASNKTDKVVLRQNSFTPITIFDTDIDKSAVQKSTEINPNLSFAPAKEETSDYVDVRNLSDYKIVGEVFNEFLVLEKGDNVIFLDFHAGHERLNYDKFVKLVNSKQVVVQDLLIPYIQKLSVQEIEFILSLKPELEKLGFDIEEFGDGNIKINTVPLQLKDINLKSFVDDLIHDIKNLKPRMNYEINNYLMQKACKSSVKSGQILTQMEINELLKNLDINHPVLLCPHGRPILTVVSRSQIEKWFKRIV